MPVLDSIVRDLFAPVCYLTVTLLCWWLLSLFYRAKARKDLRGAKPLIHIKAGLSIKDQAALRRAGYRFVIVDDTDL